MPSFLKPKAEVPPLQTGPAPYLHSRQLTSKILWITLTALLPVMAGSIFFFRWSAVRIYSEAIFCGLLFEYLFQLLTGQKTRIHDGSTLLVSILFAALMPPDASFYVIVAGIFVAVILAKELFGGLGQNLFHPVFAGFVFVLALYPDLFGQEPRMIGTAASFLIPVCGIYLIWKRKIRFENMFFYLVTSSLAIGFINPQELIQFHGFLLFTSFFLVPEPASGPITKEGRILFSATAGLMTAALSSWMNLYQAAASSVLLCNAAAPLMDEFLRVVSIYETK